MRTTRRKQAQDSSTEETVAKVSVYVVAWLQRLRDKAEEGRLSSMTQYRYSKLESCKRNSEYWKNVVSTCDWLIQLWMQSHHRELAKRITRCRNETGQE